MKSILPLLLSFIAGLSTILGAFIVFFTKNTNKKLITFALSFSAGVMLSISFFDLIPSAEETLKSHNGNFEGIIITLIFLIIGIIMAMLIDNFLPNNNTPNNDTSLYRVGLISCIALFLHNFPEGITTFVSGYHNLTIGISVTIAIALHNIPEGISIAMPIYYSTNSRKKAFKYTFLSGMTEPLGALMAFLFLKPYINELILAILFSLVAGIMIYISLAELIPEARSYKFSRLYMASLTLGICIIPLTHIFL
ncbi:zinc transporter ZupT [Clostridium sp. MSJ-8]|uniref:zinc transporter ZupT n=1 Tax=Clostridium sp. MSJ-8 TaxID=2841510 RepID=UPI001C0EA1DB|nr:zinc transporter ZupT [Clostridium sp. MSJ-8]MBU5487144.1 zinc transporter ZupT [Clostridium sp. MSJ-8]